MRKKIENIGDIFEEKFSGYSIETSAKDWLLLEKKVTKMNFLKFNPLKFNVYYLVTAVTTFVTATVVSVDYFFISSNKVEEKQEIQKIFIEESDSVKNDTSTYYFNDSLQRIPPRPETQLINQSDFILLENAKPEPEKAVKQAAETNVQKTTKHPDKLKVGEQLSSTVQTSDTVIEPDTMPENKITGNMKDTIGSGENVEKETTLKNIDTTKKTIIIKKSDIIIRDTVILYKKRKKQKKLLDGI